MVDFRKRLSKSATSKPLNPRDIYDRLDRASDKGPLRPAQEAVLDEWFNARRADRDVIIKLHTGEGKTLIGLLILQSMLNESEGQALYLCPNNFLVQQTLTQAKQFGIRAVGIGADGELPIAFLDGRTPLVCSVQKLFNGLTKFGVGGDALRVDWLVLDDAHACIDAIKEACIIRLPNDHPAYADLSTLFSLDLESQGVGKFAEINAHDSGAFLPVPYWAWNDHESNVAAILAKHRQHNAIRFAWPLLRDILAQCLCIVSGRELIITPYLAPLHQFGSFTDARHRVFMSATVTDDSFLVKGLRIPPAVVQTPLVFSGAKWSGEKMVLIPSLMDESLTHREIVNAFAKSDTKRSSGVVALVPSFDAAKPWEKNGASVATTADIHQRVEGLRSGQVADTLVIANRYDGIDLPDNACRVLILDGKPYSEGLIDQYEESCRPSSSAVANRTARVIEQGLGRAVRGEKDYCVAILSGADLIKAVRTKDARAYYSEQTRVQIELGMEISDMSGEDIREGTSPLDVLRALVNQCLRRDDGWKEFYRERMDTIADPSAPPKMLDLFSAELKAEEQFSRGNVGMAVNTLQQMLDSGHVPSGVDKGWYLQEMARYQHVEDRAESNRLQAAAHRHNRLLLKPRDGVVVQRLTPIAQRRVLAISEWMRRFDDFQALSVTIDGILTDLRFGVRAEPFERALDDLGTALGFSSERPDREWKEGPDNLWAVREGEYLLFECKSEVEATRKEIHKNETGQMNNAIAWFAREYPGVFATRILIIPTKSVARAAGFNEDVTILRDRGLKKLTQNVRGFFSAFRQVDLRDIAENKVQEQLERYSLTVDALKTQYSESSRVV